jgi:antitoxin YefM
MPTEIPYTNLRENLAGFLDQVVDQQETVIVRRKGARDVARIPVGELSGLIETGRLLRSPRNARRLLTALWRAERAKCVLQTQPTCGAKFLVQGNAKRLAVLRTEFQDNLLFWLIFGRRSALAIDFANTLDWRETPRAVLGA